MGGGDGAGRELWGALSGAASEYAQMGELKGSIPSLVNSLAASKTLWGQSMLVTWIDCVGVELRDVECAQRSCSAVDSQMRGFAGESEGRVRV